MLKLKELYEILRRDSSLTQAVDQSQRMLVSTNRMFVESVRSLRQSNTGELRLDIYQEDQRVNQYLREVRRKVLQYLAITGGVNITSGLILTSIVIDIERIGDYTKNITELATTHPRQLKCGRHDADVSKIEQAVAGVFGGIVETLKSADKDRARSLIGDNIWIKQHCDEIDRELVAGTDTDLTSSDAVTTALYVRYLKRIGAHLMNILSSVINPFDRIGFREAQEELGG